MSLQRTVNHIRSGGLAKFWRDLQYIGDAKWGRMVGVDSNGNKYWENMDEQPGRTRWVDYKNPDYDSSQLAPEWHSWLAYITADPPGSDPVGRVFGRYWQQPAMMNYTGTRGAFKTYNTTRPKILSWEPKIAARQG
ncbi:hypothetical protein MSPP1_003750 [Malassezia sp. CBS 17886]|nr:hypothetical protein MSPP1_003750 [Malassezia sp. CBS 17886]